jgi:glycosyltransferase involved in cell wall biosynthesis
MSTGARVVFGMPAYNRPNSLAQVLESLLSQTYRDFAIVIVDDNPSDEVKAIVDTYKAIDSRITYEPNSTRLGMVGNWRKAFDRGRELHPESEYYAWVSDHDIWHPRWLEVLVGVLDRQPGVVMAYPQMQRVFPTERKIVPRMVETVGLSPAERLRMATVRMTAGNGIYGLFRASALAQAGVFRPVIMPDRQVLVELSLLGEFRHVDEVLWYREVAGMFSFGRQRRMFFPGGVPIYTYLPANVQHFGVLLWDLVVRGRGRPAFGRLAGLWYALLQLWYSTSYDLTRDDSDWRLALQRTALGRRIFPPAVDDAADASEAVAQ